MNHLQTLPRPAESRCGICRRKGYHLECERCGQPFHAECYWREAPTAERAAFSAAEVDEPYAFICKACRS